jgi:hypothetical protein
MLLKVLCGIFIVFGILTACCVSTSFSQNQPNCTWNLSDGTKLGIPCEYTPDTWCKTNFSPICENITEHPGEYYQVG